MFLLSKTIDNHMDAGSVSCGRLPGVLGNVYIGSNSKPMTQKVRCSLFHSVTGTCNLSILGNLNPLSIEKMEGMKLRVDSGNMGFSGDVVIKNLPANAGDKGNMGLIPEW